MIQVRNSDSPPDTLWSLQYDREEILHWHFRERGHPTERVLRGRVLSAHLLKLKAMITIIIVAHARRLAVFYSSRFSRLPGHFDFVAWAYYGLLRN
jgi:hypothetical protein